MEAATGGSGEADRKGRENAESEKLEKNQTTL